MSRINLDVSLEDLKRVDKRADEEGVSRQDVALRALRSGLASLPPAKKKQESGTESRYLGQKSRSRSGKKRSNKRKVIDHG